MRKAIIAMVSVAVLGSLAGPAAARDDRVRVKGPCSANSEWEMRLEDRGSTLRVRWDVDSGVVGETWNMALTHNGQEIANTTRTTNANGEAELRLRGVPDLEGTDSFAGTASNPATGETCSGSASI